MGTRWWVGLGVGLISGCISVPSFVDSDTDARPNAGDASTSRDAFSGTATRSLSFFNLEGPLGAVALPVRLATSCVNLEGAGPGGENLRFSVGSTEVAHEVDHWDVDGGLVWVLVDVASGDNLFDLEFGPDVSARQTIDSQVWAGYQGVWHLNGSASEPDATGNGFTGAPINAASIPDGRFGRARRFFSGALSHVELAGSIALLGGQAEASLEMWVYPDYANDAAWPAGGDEFLTMAAGNESSPLHEFRLRRQGGEAAGNGTLRARVTEANANIAFIGFEVANKEWAHFGWSFSESLDDQIAMLDGAIQRFIQSGSLASSSGALRIGSDNGFQGRIDEVRVAHQPRTEAYFRFVSRAGNDIDFISCE